MKTEKKEVITVSAIVDSPVENVWEMWTSPDHIVKWNFATADWQCPRAENDLRAGGKFNFRMEAKDGSSGFDLTGSYDRVVPDELIEYKLDDGREVKVLFESEGSKTKVTESFEAENTHSIELQRGGWQAILDNFKKHAEGG